MRYIFYCIYNTQYLDGKNKVNKTPWFDALGMMMGGSFLWLSIISEVFYFYILNRNTPTASIVEVPITCVFLFYTHYFGFIKDKKYEKIYEKYKVEDGNHRTKEKWIAILYIFLPALIFMSIALLWHKVI
ncbi:hypothetical protein [Mucilaginibacter sp.]|uniref:hypothetical protein n=1 Tax=Mucilaginibacter sp. TaxID=1882438 RepID=UPI003D0C01C3